MIKPLKNVRVLDLTNVLAGPFCGHQLALMGADVIKVETPGTGDLARQLGADPELNGRLMGLSFLAQNAGKRSMTLNLKKAEGKEIFLRLVKNADVVIENFRPGVMKRLGLDFTVLRQHQPRLVYCAISGFGQEGPLRNLPAYDQIIQGMSGTMSITGDPANAPYRVGYPIADTVGGLTAAFAVAATLADHSRSEAQFIDVSMLESMIATMGWAVSNYMNAGQEPRPMGNENSTASPSGTFKTGDGLLNIAANKQEQFEALCKVLGRDDLACDSRYSVREARLQNRLLLKEQIERALAGRPAIEWWPLLTDAGIPAGPIYEVKDALAHPQIRDRGMIATFENVPGADRDIRVVRSGVKLNGDSPAVDTPPPILGQDTNALLEHLGYTREDITRFNKEGIV
ncbi:CaiB/BaiF CoA transferase family protein [Paralcaligenes ureilyticus]|uniref:Crotonobetainyl-CoA:carnitine CoA-transferase CaiB-like acyl-CoA transferase n=1 Tax=Paralcaligenes ureilyticus TaxID=627131 RepID=A0A4R3M308_9BURK|nr:CoA transferase [Paralcaligenes ureilyticus]TCT07402.1 crotonobetainyl-CoA:carnitine CoA-transferase CaiB-like acyl-CoA transferase [Paralcaligenes ureilyticus]